MCKNVDCENATWLVCNLPTTGAPIWFLYYKVIYSRKMSIRNGVRVMVNGEMKGKVVEVVRKSDRVIMVNE